MYPSSRRLIELTDAKVASAAATKAFQLMQGKLTLRSPRQMRGRWGGRETSLSASLQTRYKLLTPANKQSCG